MAITAGVLSQVSVGARIASLLATAVTGDTPPTTYQWYRSTTSGFTPGGGNIIAGATALALNDTGLIPGTQYYYKVVATDTLASVTYTQLALATTQESPSPNQFAQTSFLGMIDLRFPTNTVSVQIDVSQVGNLVAGQAVKMVDSAGGVPKVIGCTADTDEVLGFLNYSPKDASYSAGKLAEISMSQNVMFLLATTAIARGARVTLDVTTKGGVASAVTGDRLVGWAYDKAAIGDLFRVFLTTPSFTVAP